ncbi:MAG: hypothetical protein JSS81_11620 [Acidobacteria bacterium]|nr:hypothetical protein [Acidobacteriota bacterium]
MTLDITEKERELLADVLRSAHEDLREEMHYTERFEYKELLRERFELLKELQAKVEAG